jgi:hypothetical protein
MTIKNDRGWTTQSEIDYLKFIGKFRPDDDDKITFLRGYIEAIPKRVRWSEMDSEKIMRFATQLLNEALANEC